MNFANFEFSPMMTAGNLLFEVRFEIGMLAGLGYWKKGILGTKAEGGRGGGDSSRLLMKCLVVSDMLFLVCHGVTISIF